MGGEYAFLDDTACNLASINLVKFYDIETNEFNIEGYLHCIGLVQLMLESAIHWGQFPTEDVARKSYMFRTTGLGVGNLSSLLMRMAIPYDSDEARSLGSSLTSIMTGYSYYISSLIAKKIGTFEKYALNKKYMLKVIRNHCRVSGSLNDKYEDLHYEPIKLSHKKLKKMDLNILSLTVKDVWKNALEYGEKYGYRNAQVSVIAPMGTISFAMDCGATSIEPLFSHVAYKKLVGGGYMEIINPEIPNALRKLKYTEKQIEDIMKYILRKETVTENGYTYEKIADGKIEGSPYLKEEHLPIFDTANKCGTGERYISPMGHVKMVASLTPMVSGSISKTVNLPRNATKEDISDIYLQAWKLGCKGITCYKDGSKACQPLNSTKDDNTNTKFEDMTYNDLVNKAYDLQKQINKPKRTKAEGIRVGKTHPAEIDGVKIYTTVNRRENGEICEIYITTDREGSTITGLLNSLSKSISVMLQHHVAPVDIANMLKGQQYEPNGFTNRHPYIRYCDSISDLISRIIEIEIGDYSRCQIKPQNTFKESTDKIKENQNQVSLMNNNVKDTKEKIIVNDKEFNKKDVVVGSNFVCPTCGCTKYVSAGTCKYCVQCGTSNGCS